MTPIVRFAPSPTGLLHVGNARVALVNWLYARHRGGRFVLRFDDTDTERSKPEYVEAISRDLAWLGLAWDEVAFQSRRLDRYHQVAQGLKAQGRLYPCYETPEELEYKRRRQLARGLPPVYDRAGLTLDEDARLRLEAEGRRPHWRFRLDLEDVRWPDMVRGDSHVQASSLSDPVLIRADGTYLYTLPSVTDDIDMGVTHVIRGEDHVTNTAPQIQLFEALGGSVPIFAHLPLMVGAEGQGLSKRLGSLSLAELHDDGIEAMAVNSLLARLGTSEAVEARHSLDDLARHFDFDHVGRASPRFDPAELAHVNARLLHAMSWDEARPRLAALGLAEAGEAFWEAIRPNLARLDEAASWWPVVADSIEPVIEEAGFLALAARLLPPEPWDVFSWSAWIEAVKPATGRKGRALFHPLRLALTGRENGPEMKALLPLIGRERALARLAGRKG